MGGARAPRCVLLGCRALSRGRGTGLPLSLWPRPGAPSTRGARPSQVLLGSGGRELPGPGPVLVSGLRQLWHGAWRSRLGMAPWNSCGGGPLSPALVTVEGPSATCPLQVPLWSLSFSPPEAGGVLGAHMSSDVDPPRVTPLLGGAWHRSPGPWFTWETPARARGVAGGREHQLSPAVGRGCVQPSPISLGPPAALCRSPRP